MKEKIVSILMLALILTSTLSIAFVIRPSLAENGFLNENFMEKNRETGLPNQTNKPDQASILNNDWRNIFERRLGAEQGENLESPSQTSRLSEDKWNFSDTSEWSNIIYVDGNKTRLIVGVNDENPTSLLELERIAAAHQAKIIDTVSIGGEVRAVVVELLLVSVTAFVEETRAVELASYIEPNMKVQALFVPNDPYWSMQWGPQKIEADWAWNTTVGDPSVLVAVVDTGIDYTHPDLAANYASLGYDWVNIDADPLDDFGHGTHCAGIIAAVLNNGIGMAGLAQVRIMAEKVLDYGGSGYWDWVANGIVHAVDQGANVISMSLGGYGDSELMHDAVKYAYDAGVLVIAAAGNDNTNMKLYPAGYDEVIAVAATDQYDNKAGFSNWGDWIELAAPGVGIYSTMPTYHVTLNDWGYAMNYDYLSGTSMACPHVSGVAALVWSRYPSKTRDWVRLWLRYTADDLGDPGFDIYYGYGRINARKAVEQTPPPHELIVSNWVTPPYVKLGSLETINATILNFGENETDVTVQLLANGTIADSVMIDSLAAGNSTSVSLSWNPAVEGLYNVTLYVVPVPGETSVENNVVSKYIYVGFPVKAVVLHSAGNIDGSIITNWQALNNEWLLFGDTMVYIDYTTLNKEGITYEDIVATEADVLIISCAYDPYMGWQFTDSEIEAIKRYVHEGHGLIATAGTLYYGVPNNNKLAPLFGMSEATMWTATRTDLLHLLNTTHPIFNNVPDPLVFPQVQTALPYDGRWDSNELVDGKYLALGHYQESAIATYRGLIYISPWLEIIPPYYHHHLQLLYNAITRARYQKPEHELNVSLQCPIHLKPGESVVVNATVANMGLNNETNIELFLLLNGSQAANLTIPILAVGESETLSYLWTPTEGAYNVTAYAPPVLGEEETFNNVETILLSVSYAAVIGFIETHGESLHSEELKNFYQNMGHIVVTIYSTLTPELLSDYDILIIGEDWYNNPWLPSEIAAVQDFIGSGRGFVGIGDELAYAVRGILGEYGIAYTGFYGNPGSSSNFDHSHPIMKGVTSFYASSPVNSLQAVPPGYWIANDAYNVYMLIAGAEVGGWVLCMSDDFAAAVYSDDNEIMFANIIEWMQRYEHDLTVSLDAPAFLEPSDSVLLNATVRNRGLSDETNVELKLLINDTIVDSVVVSELLTGESHTLSYAWTPTLEGMYNITSYAPPVENETFVVNNKATKFATVTQPLIHPIEGQYANYTIYYIDPSGKEIYGGLWNFTYLCYISPYQMKITMWTEDPYGGMGSSWMIVNIFTRMVERDSGIYWTGMWYPGWIETNVTIGSTINLLWGNATIVGSEVIQVMGRSVGCWEIQMENYGYMYTFWYDKVSGLWIGMKALSPSPTYMGTYLILTATNVPISFLEHDLAVTLDAPKWLSPSTSTILNATVHNGGLSNEANVMLQLTINGSIVASEVIPGLASGDSYTLSYSWTPLVEGLFDVTAYAPPVPNEEYVENNFASVDVRVRYVIARVAILNSWEIPSYFAGGWDNNYQLLMDALNAQGFHAQAVTNQEIINGILSFFDVFVMIDNVPNEAAVPHVVAFWSNGGGLVAFDSSICFLCYAGILPSESSGSNGYYVYWDYETSYQAKISVEHPVTAGYEVGQIINGASGDAEYRVDTLAGTSIYPYYTMLAEDLTRPNRAYVSAYEPPMAGNVVHIWDYSHWSNTNLQLMILNAMEWATAPRYEHDLAVSVLAPSYLEPSEPFILRATVHNLGLNNETNVDLQLLINGTIVASSIIPNLPVGSSYKLNYPWAPTAEGIYNVTAYAPPLTNETRTANNIASAYVSVIVIHGTSLRVTPRQSIVPVDRNFTISMNIVNVTNLIGYQFYMYYDTRILDGLEIEVPPDHFLTPTDPSKIFWAALKIEDNYNTTHGRIIVCALLLPPEAPKNGSGLLVNITFKAKAVGSSILHLSHTILADPLGEDIPHVTLDGSVEVIIQAPADVAIVSVTPSSTVVYEGRMVNITVVARNEGNTTETFNVTAYYDSSIIGTQLVVDLPPGENITLTFNWNTSGLTPCHSYIISAYAWPVPGEIDTGDNILSDGTVKIAMLGDVNADGAINLSDLIKAAMAFGAIPGSPAWNPQADIYPDGKVNITDLVKIAQRFGQHC